MNTEAIDVDLDGIEYDIDRHFRTLRFSSRMERHFEADVSDERCRHMIRQNYIGIIIYHCFLIGDYKAIRDAFGIDLFVHLAVMTPLMVVTNLVLARRPAAWVREGVETLAIMILTLTIVLVVSQSRSPDRDVVQLSIVLVVLFATVMQRLRFWYVVAACAVTQLFYSLGLAAITPFSMERALISNSVFVGILLFSLVGAYNLEHEQRMGYLLRLRDRLRHRELERISLRDALTGVGNRRALETAFARIMDAAGRCQATDSAVLLLDIDHFKQFNDDNGHQKGDACLKRVADLVAGSLSERSGSVFRFGGEEFLVLLNDMSLTQALDVAERIRACVARDRIARNATANTVLTVSVGVAAGCIGSTATPESLVAAADEALYWAKRNGRNQIAPRPYLELAEGA